MYGIHTEPIHGNPLVEERMLDVRTGRVYSETMPEPLTPLNALLAYGRDSEEYMRACMSHEEESSRAFKEAMDVMMDVIYPQKWADDWNSEDDSADDDCTHCSCYEDGVQCCECGNSAPVDTPVDNS